MGFEKTVALPLCVTLENISNAKERNSVCIITASMEEFQVAFTGNCLFFMAVARK
jgi:hypothetical protein